MGLPGGRTIPLSPLRRVMTDIMHVSRSVPLVAVERRLLIGEVIEARKRTTTRPSWFALFMKAYALVAARRDDLRRSFLTFPWPRLHQHTCNVAHLMIGRHVGDEDVVLGIMIRYPERLPLAEIDAVIRRARTEPIQQIGDFRRFLLMSRLPGPLRRLVFRAGLRMSGNWRARFCGTFGLTGVGALGCSSLHLLSPLTTTLTYGVFEQNGSVLVRLFYDHRILDGIAPAEALQELEQNMNGPILQELRAASRRVA
jgi:hypothetical protein